jgi:hypothetical protein
MSELSSVIGDLPESLSIGFAEWTVEVVPKGSLKSADDIDSLGLCETEFFTIKIADGQTDTNAKNTFIHELLHAVYAVHGLPDEVDEETAVASLTNGLMAALQDNVDLQVWWVNHLCGDIEYA